MAFVFFLNHEFEAYRNLCGRTMTPRAKCCIPLRRNGPFYRGGTAKKNRRREQETSTLCNIYHVCKRIRPLNRVASTMCASASGSPFRSTLNTNVITGLRINHASSQKIKEDGSVTFNMILFLACSRFDNPSKGAESAGCQKQRFEDVSPITILLFHCHVSFLGVQYP